MNNKAHSTPLQALEASRDLLPSAGKSGEPDKWKQAFDAAFAHNPEQALRIAAAIADTNALDEGSAAKVAGRAWKQGMTKHYGGDGVLAAKEAASYMPKAYRRSFIEPVIAEMIGEHFSEIQERFPEEAEAIGRKALRYNEKHPGSLGGPARAYITVAVDLEQSFTNSESIRPDATPDVPRHGMGSRSRTR